MNHRGNGQGMRSEAEHPGETLLAAYADGELAGSELTAVESHLDQCDSCRAALAEVAILLDSASGAQPIVRPRRKISRTWWLAPAALAASIAIVLLQREPTKRAADVVRLNPSEDLASLQVITPTNNATVPVNGVQLKWRAIDAAQYQVHVLNSEGDLVWSVTTAQSEADIPAGTLHAATAYVWYVDAFTNRVVATTHVQNFKTTP